VHRGGRQRRILVVLAVSAVVLSVLGYSIWPGFNFLDGAKTPTGGVLLLHDQVSTADDATLLGQRASINVEMWETGSPGVSILALRLNFSSPQWEGRWHIVASGDYAVDADLDNSLYCKYGRGHAHADRIRCSEQVGNPEIEFSFDQELGSWSGSRAVDGSVVDLAGYDRGRVTIISGSMPETNEIGENIVDVWLPITTPRSNTVNGDEFVAVPPIAPRPRMFGEGPLLAQPCTLKSSVQFLFALTDKCEPVAVVQVSDTTVDIGLDLGRRTVEYASPDTVTDDAVTWHVSGGFPGAQALIADPFAQEDDSRRAFIAALILSISVSFGLLLVERRLFHRRVAGRSE
jgi:hypothetical protein